MRKQLTIAALAALALAACSGDDTLALPGGGTGPATGPAVDPSQVQINIGVANDGSGFATRALADDHRKNVYTSAAIQKIDNVKLIICKPAASVTSLTTGATGNMWGTNTYDSITHVHTFTDWMNTSTVAVNGRESVWKPAAGAKLLLKGQQYMAYAVGFSSNAYTETQRFAAVGVGTTAEFSGQNDADKYAMPRTVEKSDMDEITEIFAGSTDFTVAASGGVSATVSLHRQNAGAIGYFTKIPVYGDETVEADGTKHSTKKGRYLRLVACNLSNGIRMAQFNDAAPDPTATATSNDRFVVNGIEASGVYGLGQFYATQKAGTTFAQNVTGHNAGDPYTDGYVVYNIDLCEWFPGGTDGLPLDKNNDGMLDSSDANWDNPLRTASQTVAVKKGSVVAGTFFFPFVPAVNAQNLGNPTFELQLLDKSKHIIRVWNVKLGTDDPQVAATNTGTADAPVMTPTNPVYVINQDGTMTKRTIADTQERFCTLRNHLYTIGKRNTVTYDPDDPNPKPNPDPDPNPDDHNDEPQDLTKTDLRTYCSGAWEALHQAVLD